MRAHHLSTTIRIALAAALGAFPLARGDERGPPRFGKDAKIILTESSVASLLAPATDAWQPRVAGPTRSGGGIYARVAPATVAVQTETRYGTGFLVAGDGLLVTNYHVIADGMRLDARRRASVAQVHLGRLDANGAMVLSPAPLDALFYAADTARDLALLKIVGIPKAFMPLPHVALARQATRPGDPCAMIGHPLNRLMWTFRSCEVQSIGRNPASFVDFVIRRLGAVGPARDEVAASLAGITGHSIVATSCEGNLGDSGGPLLDKDGSVVGVTFAIPGDMGRPRSTYHANLGELRAFLDAAPAHPTVLAPDAWALGAKVQLLDVAGEAGRPVLAAGNDDAPEQYLFDLDGDTDAALLRVVDRSLVASRKFDAEFALVVANRRRIAFYDTDNDATFDLIVICTVAGTGAGTADVRLTLRRHGGWDIDAHGGSEPCVRPDRFGDRALARRLEVLLLKLAL